MAFEDQFKKNQHEIARYYRIQAHIYDLTRWVFLFGRQALIEALPSTFEPNRVLEIGCGTGKNLDTILRAYPNASALGVDLSAEMIDKAERRLTAFGSRVSFEQIAYHQPISPYSGETFDLILCSYALSMMNPGWDDVIETAVADLSPNGIMAVVDFHDSRFPAFKRWLGVNHVRMDSHLLPKLNELFEPIYADVKPVYAGWWDICLFLGAVR